MPNITSLVLVPEGVAAIRDARAYRLQKNQPEPLARIGARHHRTDNPRGRRIIVDRGTSDLSWPLCQNDHPVVPDIDFGDFVIGHWTHNHPAGRRPLHDLRCLFVHQDLPLNSPLSPIVRS